VHLIGGGDRVDGTAGGRAAWREACEALARRHPRETWASHANLGELARFWLQRRHAAADSPR
jgi:hypothetical protein